jgi:hypothetical protein
MRNSKSRFSNGCRAYVANFIINECFAQFVPLVSEGTFCALPIEKSGVFMLIQITKLGIFARCLGLFPQGKITRN